MSTIESCASQPEELTWQLVEKVTALLEQALTPEARVKHNELLPVVGRPNRSPRQCDVVIRYGVPPRETIAIVEVQKRQEKPDINTFNGWVEKMREVGAQHLYCVSATGFPDSILDKVINQLGPTVRLLTLEELEKCQLPGLSLVPYIQHVKPSFKLKEIGAVKLEQSPGMQNLQICTSDRIFYIEQTKKQLSLDELLADALRQLRQAMNDDGILEPDSATCNIELGSHQQSLQLLANGQYYKVISIPLTVELSAKKALIPMRMLSYRQELIGDTLAWVAAATAKVDEKSIEAEVVFTPDSERRLQISAARIVGGVGLRLLFSPDAGVIESMTEGAFKFG